MSTASYVPPTRELDGWDVAETLRSTSLGRLLRDSFLRFRRADGFSFARALAFQLVFTAIPGVILAVALAARMGDGAYRAFLREAITTLAPGPAGEIFLRAFAQGSEAGGTGNTAAVLAGGVTAVVAAVTAMAQLQRGASRIYGVKVDRPTVRRYAVATALTLSVGALLTCAFVAIVLGSRLGGAMKEEISSLWVWVRWPIGIVFLAVGLAGLMKVAPNRTQPRLSWLLSGAGVGVLGWLGVSVALSIYLNASTSFGETYGPLAGFVGFLLWSQLSGISILFGVAVAAQLEAIRAGVPHPTVNPEDQPAEAAGGLVGGGDVSNQIPLAMTSMFAVARRGVENF